MDQTLKEAFRCLSRDEDNYDDDGDFATPQELQSLGYEGMRRTQLSVGSRTAILRGMLEFAREVAWDEMIGPLHRALVEIEGSTPP